MRRSCRVALRSAVAYTNLIPALHPTPECLVMPRLPDCNFRGDRHQINDKSFSGSPPPRLVRQSSLWGYHDVQIIYCLRKSCRNDKMCPILYWFWFLEFDPCNESLTRFLSTVSCFTFVAPNLNIISAIKSVSALFCISFLWLYFTLQYLSILWMLQVGRTDDNGVLLMTIHWKCCLCKVDTDDHY